MLEFSPGEKRSKTSKEKSKSVLGNSINILQNEKRKTRIFSCGGNKHNS